MRNSYSFYKTQLHHKGQEFGLVIRRPSFRVDRWSWIQMLPQYLLARATVGKGLGPPSPHLQNGTNTHTSQEAVWTKRQNAQGWPRSRCSVPVGYHCHADVHADVRPTAVCRKSTTWQTLCLGRACREPQPLSGFCVASPLRDHVGHILDYVGRSVGHLLEAMDQSHWLCIPSS